MTKSGVRNTNNELGLILAVKEIKRALQSATTQYISLGRVYCELSPVVLKTVSHWAQCATYPIERSLFDCYLFRSYAGSHITYSHSAINCLISHAIEHSPNQCAGKVVKT